MEKVIIIPEYIYEQIITEGNKRLPYEACGLLAGNKNQVHSFWPLNNHLQSSRRFFVPKEEVRAAERQIINKKEQVLAVFHTHPSTKAVPSYYDLQNHPTVDVAMVIVSFKHDDPVMKWYAVRHNDYHEVKWSIV
ncbi:M67 family metallopeptidase [Gracilibacillus sp. S3-1-1]|uniref:M67 family metallopeptidase n=1 Tax=Gracilibacillus pellucidus TaxID=3095368 RepID=A0ACC6M6M2_9BACI|nr:M67 family metallopeptidase [Gracilibacillus sp. S3-1-1]MDX8046614.1 M67 family metallopeptidase [Gracilibacillus sp. S3-1-1]